MKKATLAALPLLLGALLTTTAAEETPYPLKVITLKAIYQKLALDTTNSADISYGLTGLFGIKGKGEKGLSLCFVGKPSLKEPAVIGEVILKKEGSELKTSVTYCEKIVPESGTVDDTIALKATIATILQLMKNESRTELAESHPVVTAVKELSPPVAHPDGHQYLIAVEEEAMLRALKVAVITDKAGKLLEMKILKSIP